jgi:hypothetical protein
MSLSNCKECIAAGCENAGKELKAPCFSYKPSKPVEELVLTELPKKKSDLVPTMNLRLMIKTESSCMLQQQFVDRNVINTDGTAGGARWVDIPKVNPDESYYIE